MTAVYTDYRWSSGMPQGVSPLADPVGVEHFRVVDVDGGMRLEQFDGDRKFQRLIFCPADEHLGGASYETSADHRHRVRRDADGAVLSYEEYTWPGDVYSDDAYPEVAVYNAHGRLVWQHRPRRLSATAWDIHVLDALGKPRRILHHTDVGPTEPCTIREEWVE